MNLKQMSTLSIAIAALLLAGCAKTTFKINNGNATNPQYDNMENYFVAGVGQEKVIDAAQICGGAHNVIKVETERTAIDGVLGSITDGIYTPRHARVYCRK